MSYAKAPKKAQYESVETPIRKQTASPRLLTRTILVPVYHAGGKYKNPLMFIVMSKRSLYFEKERYANLGGNVRTAGAHIWSLYGAYIDVHSDTSLSGNGKRGAVWVLLLLILVFILRRGAQFKTIRLKIFRDMTRTSKLAWSRKSHLLGLSTGKNLQ